MSTRADWRTPIVILLASSIIITLSMGIRHGFGLYLQPMTSSLNWNRETFALAIAIQNLVWGLSQPIVGMIADRYGANRVVIVGALFYALGLFFMAHSTNGLELHLSAGVLIGLGLSGTTFSVLAGVLTRAYPPEKRSMVLGLSAAAGSFGQFAVLPLTQGLISGLGWFASLFVLAALAGLLAPLGYALAEKGGTAPEFKQSAGQAMQEALGHRGYVLLTTGFFVCGFQVVFIGVHLPSYLLDRGFPAHIGVTALALIGLFNIIGTYSAGLLGARFSKKYLLSIIYFSRSVAALLFLLLPLTPWSIYAFSIAIGLLWLSTVPLTNGIVGQIFGVRYLAMLSGFVFLSHQIGSFLGAWLGGYLFDHTGSYQIVWLIFIALGIVAALINLPIDERPVQRQPIAAS